MFDSTNASSQVDETETLSASGRAAFRAELHQIPPALAAPLRTHHS